MESEIYDPVLDDLDFPEFEQQLKRYPLDVVGISTYTHSLPDVQMTINIVRKLNPKAIIVLGGPHCSMFPDYAIELDGADAIITGDGEDAFVEMLEATDAGKSWEESSESGSRKTGRPSKTRTVRRPRGSMPTPGRTVADFHATTSTTCREPRPRW